MRWVVAGQELADQIAAELMQIEGLMETSVHEAHSVAD